MVLIPGSSFEAGCCIQSIPCFAVCLAAGLDGIQKKIYPTKASDRSLSESDQKEQGIENLPENLREAITLFEDSSWMKEILGEAFCKQYAQAKRKEWLRYSQEISDWEIEEYSVSDLMNEA